MTGLQISTIILAITFTVMFFVWISAVAGTITEDRRHVENRMAGIKGRKHNALGDISQRRRKRRLQLEERSEKNTSAQQKKIMDTIFNELVLADIVMAPEEFLTIWIALIFIPSGLAALISHSLMSSLALAAFAVVGPIVFINSKKKKRTKAFEAQLSDGLLIICNCLRAGLSFQQAMESIGEQMSAPIGTEFTRACNEIRYGASLEQALDNMVARVKSPDLLLAVSSVNIQRTTGGNLSEILSTISETIKQRLRIKAEIATITAQGRMSGLMIGALPPILAGILMIINPSYMSVFFNTTPGNIMLAVSAVMEVIGFFMIRKIVTIEY